MPASSSPVSRIEEASAAMLAELNELYARVHFVPSELPRDRTFFARDLTDSVVALGRLSLYPDALELGGFWVREDQRGQGLARRMVSHVLANLRPGQVAYCIPFQPLVPFYASFGMQAVSCGETLPPSIGKKLSFCRVEHEQGRYVSSAAVLRYKA